ncbi:MAG TPA: hypothetical protein VMS04_11050 [Vicinamibacterales bacterium]|jgi:hypothetical protein|nr:hypothetical protein [Vicinamibacterales bacterium]
MMPRYVRAGRAKLIRVKMSVLFRRKPVRAHRLSRRLAGGGRLPWLHIREKLRLVRGGDSPLFGRAFEREWR